MSTQDGIEFLAGVVLAILLGLGVLASVAISQGW